MIKKISSRESMFLQTLAIINLLAELDQANFLQSDYFSQLKYQDEEYKLLIEKTGIGNTGLLQMTLYALLVLPKELEIYETNMHLDNINRKIDELVENSDTYTNYKKDNSKKEEKGYKMNYLLHIRNAVSHGQCEYSNYNNEDKFVIFRDKDPMNNNYYCKIKIKTCKLNEIIYMLKNRVIEFLNENHDLKELSRNIDL